MRTGRPRDTDIDAAALQATAEMLDSDGYRGVVIEDVARRAGVSKTAVYRRWPKLTGLLPPASQRRPDGLR